MWEVVSWLKEGGVNGGLREGKDDGDDGGRGVVERSRVEEDLPDAFQVHGPYLYYMLLFLGLEDTVSATSCHACDVEELGAIDHVVVYPSTHQYNSNYEYAGIWGAYPPV
jgi:hypothetical protein